MTWWYGSATAPQRLLLAVCDTRTAGGFLKLATPQRRKVLGLEAEIGRVGSSPYRLIGERKRQMSKFDIHLFCTYNANVTTKLLL
jgi:hypothetical protein